MFVCLKGENSHIEELLYFESKEAYEMCSLFWAHVSQSNQRSTIIFITTKNKSHVIALLIALKIDVKRNREQVAAVKVTKSCPMYY